jgi:predicted TIM-barrel fold metal-dependent hydrolase
MVLIIHFRPTRRLEFVEEMQQSGMVTEEQLEQIAYRNAEELLGLKAR